MCVQSSSYNSLGNLTENKKKRRANAETIIIFPVDAIGNNKNTNTNSNSGRLATTNTDNNNDQTLETVSGENDGITSDEYYDEFGILEFANVKAKEFLLRLGKILDGGMTWDDVNKYTKEIDKPLFGVDEKTAEKYEKIVRQLSQ